MYHASRDIFEEAVRDATCFLLLRSALVIVSKSEGITVKNASALIPDMI